MANELDELSGYVNAEGRDVNVIEKQLAVKVGAGSLIFEVLLWVCGILPGLIFLLMKVNAANYFRKLQQKIQADASQIDNYLEQRVQILQNVAPLVAKAIDLDKDVMKSVAAFRGGRLPEGERNEVSRRIDASFARLFPQIEAYPELRHIRPSPTPCSKTAICKRRSRQLAVFTTTPSINGTPTFLPGPPI